MKSKQGVGLKMKDKDKINAVEKDAFENAEKRGYEIGAKRKALEIAKTLLDVLDQETIAKSTGLSIEEINSLK